MAFVDVALAVGSFVGADALGATAATVIGGGIMGAGAGALYGGLTGGSMGKDALIGGLLGGTAGGIGSAMGLGAGADISTAAASGMGPGAALTQIGGQAIPAGALDASAAAADSAGYAGTNAAGALNQVAGSAPSLASTDYAALSPAQIAATPANPVAGGIPSWAKWGAGALALGALANKSNQKYGTIPQTQVATNPLPYPSNFNSYNRLDTSVIRPMGTPTSTYPGYAAGGDISEVINNTGDNVIKPTGGTVEQMSRDNASGSNQNFPQSNVAIDAFSSPTNTPFAHNVLSSAADTNVDPYTGQEKFAKGGIAGAPNLGSYAAGGNPRLLKGPGDGMSDDIPAQIGVKQPARLADGEFVVPADVVSHLGNGSTDAGAKHLYNMMDKVRKARTGRKAQGKEIKADKFLPK